MQIDTDEYYKCMHDRSPEVLTSHHSYTSSVPPALNSSVTLHVPIHLWTTVEPRTCVVPLPRDWNCRSGWPRHTWLQTMAPESDLAPLNIDLTTAYRRAQNRQAWSRLIWTATSSTGQAARWWR